MRSSPFNRVHSELFGSGEQGIYTPSVHESFLRGDLFQDAAGNTPVTAVGQSVGLWLDRSRGLVLGPELVVTQDLTDASWRDLPATPANTRTNNTLTFGGQYSGIRLYIPSAAGEAFEFAFEIRRISGNASLNIYNDPNQTLNITTAGGLPITVTDNWQQFSVIRICKGPSIDVGIQDRNATGHGTVELRNISLRELPGNHANQPTAASRPTLRQDANGIYVLRFDGVDDGLNATQIDVSKLLVIAACQSDTDTTNVLWSNIISGTNRTYISAETDIVRWVHYDSTSYNKSLAPPPIKNIIRGVVDLLNKSGLTLTVNGLPPNGTSGGASNSTTGMSIGKDTGGNSPFKGDIYGLIVCGAEKSLAQIERAESLINQYTGAY